LSDQQVLKGLSEGLLRSTGRTGMSGNLLEIHHPSAPLFEPSFLHTEYDTWGVSISLCYGDANDCGNRVACATDALPFQDRAFRVVVLHHLVGDGSEPELAEAVRVLSNDGVLLVLGLNRMGWRYRRQKRVRRFPGLAPMAVQKRLEELEMRVQGCAGAGLAGHERPAFISTGLRSLALPVADVVLLQARHQDNPMVTPLKFRKTRRAVVQSAAASGG
jgi:SAM-dependent methyltransferase